MQQVKISQISKIDLEQGEITAIELDFNEHEEIQEEFLIKALASLFKVALTAHDNTRDRQKVIGKVFNLINENCDNQYFLLCSEVGKETTSMTMPTKETNEEHLKLLSDVMSSMSGGFATLIHSLGLSKEQQKEIIKVTSKCIKGHLEEFE